MKRIKREHDDIQHYSEIQTSRSFACEVKFRLAGRLAGLRTLFLRPRRILKILAESQI